MAHGFNNEQLLDDIADDLEVYSTKQKAWALQKEIEGETYLVQYFVAEGEYEKAPNVEGCETIASTLGEILMVLQDQDTGEEDYSSEFFGMF